MIRLTDYLALILATLVLLVVSLLHYRNQYRSASARELGNRLVLSAQVLLAVSWILILLAQG